MENTWNFSPVTNPIFTDPLNNLKEGRLIIKNNSSYSDIVFKKVTIFSTPTINQFLIKYGNHSCDFSIGGILMWATYFDYSYAIVHNTLFLKGTDPETKQIIYYKPIGEMDKFSALELLNNLSSSDNNSILISNEEEDYSIYKQRSHLNSLYFDDWKEYLYPIEHFIGFPGKLMSKKRNHLNYFKSHYSNYKIEEISKSNIEELITFSQEFMDTHKESEVFSNEAEESIKVLRNYTEYPFFGISLRLNNKIIGYSIAEKIGDVCFIHIEKGNILYQGIYQAIASEMANYIYCKFPEVKYLNREEDMGVESLKKSKESYHPSLIINKKIVKLPLVIEKRIAI